MKMKQKMQTKQASKDRACAKAWHQDRRADFRATSKDFLQEDISEWDEREGAF